MSRLKELAARRGSSLAELVREGVDHVLSNAETRSQEDRRSRAIQAVGRFRSGVSDVALEHDSYLDKAHGP